jgi:hypothetical protein
MLSTEQYEHVTAMPPGNPWRVGAYCVLRGAERPVSKRPNGQRSTKHQAPSTREGLVPNLTPRSRTVRVRTVQTVRNA